ncbi:PilW family protein [Acinetobacter sp. G11]|uniref:PilW family protein n=1 Tax=Acinetobacter sp. G11 TaxID=3415989 RepID=UPI003C7B9A74
MNNLNFSQRGVSLLEILIAMALSIIIILAMLRAFITTGKVTAESSLGAKVDSSMTLGFIAADRILQGMGFGITNTNAGYGTNFQVLDSEGNTVNLDSTSKKAAGKFLVWKVSDTDCQALQSHSNGLYFYGKNTGYSCSSLAKPADTLAKELLIQVESTLSSSGISNNTNNIGEINIQVQEISGCLPFGVKNSTSSGGKYQVLLTAKTYAASSATSAKTISNVTCLVNFK